MALGISNPGFAAAVIEDGSVVPVIILDLAHADLDTLHLCDDNTELTVQSLTYRPLAFGVQLPQDTPEEVPSVQLALDNTDYLDTYTSASAWLRAAGTAGGATARIRGLLRRKGAAGPDLELSSTLAAYDFQLQVGRLTVQPYGATVRLDFPNTLSRPAVAIRYDPENFPWMFPSAQAQT